MDSFAGDFFDIMDIKQSSTNSTCTLGTGGGGLSCWMTMINPMAGKQLMVLWSTKDNDVVHINDVEWKPKGTPGFDEQGAIQVDGMVCAWWFDGSSDARRNHRQSV